MKVKELRNRLFDANDDAEVFILYSHNSLNRAGTVDKVFVEHSERDENRTVIKPGSALIVCVTGIDEI